MKNLPIGISNHSYNGGDSIVAKIVLVTVQSVKVTIRVLENEFRQMNAAIQSIQVVKLNCLNFNPSPSIHSQVNPVHGKTCQECSLILYREVDFMKNQTDFTFLPSIFDMNRITIFLLQCLSQGNVSMPSRSIVLLQIGAHEDCLPMLLYRRAEDG